MLSRPPSSTLFPYTTPSDLIGKILTSRLSLSKHLAHNLGNLLLLGKIGVFRDYAPNAYRSEERFSRNAETDLVCRLLLEKKKYVADREISQVNDMCYLRLVDILMVY